MKTIIDGGKIMTAGMLVLLGPLPPWAMFAVITAGMIYNFKGRKSPYNASEPLEKSAN
jgi:hypothetical protein